MSTRRTQDERVRASTEALLDAAVRVVARHGYAGASPALIAAEAGFDRKMIHHRFGSKEGLFRALFEQRVQDPMLAPSSGSEQSGLERAIGTMVALEEMWRRDHEFLRAVFTIAFQITGTDSELNGIFRRWVQASLTAVENALRRGQSDGSVRTDIDPADAARVAVDATTGVVYRWCRDPHLNALDVEIAMWTAMARELFGAPER